MYIYLTDSVGVWASLYEMPQLQDILWNNTDIVSHFCVPHRCKMFVLLLFSESIGRTPHVLNPFRAMYQTNPSHNPTNSPQAVSTELRTIANFTIDTQCRVAMRYSLHINSNARPPTFRAIDPPQDRILLFADSQTSRQQGCVICAERRCIQQDAQS